MSEYRIGPGGYNTIESLPLLDMRTAALDPIDEMQQAGLGTEFLSDLRQEPDPRARIDGFIASNGSPTGGRTWRQLDEDWRIAREQGIHPETFFLFNVDLRGAAVRVRDARPDESIRHYADYMTNRLLVNTVNANYIRLPNATDAPGTRFIGSFGPDSDLVAIGKVFRGDGEGARNTIDNSVYLANRYDGMVPNFNGLDSLGRGSFPTLSFAVESLAASYGRDGDEVIAHYQEPLAKNLAYWTRGMSELQQTPHNKGDVQNRLILFPGPERDIAPRFKGDARKNLDTWEGLRRESAAEDVELAERVLHGLSGEARRQRFEKLMDDIEASCMAKMDFAPDAHSSDYHSLENLRTTDIAPVGLMAALVHEARMTGQTDLADYWAKMIMRRFFVNIDESHAQLVDLDRDGQPTKALYAGQFMALGVGGIVPYEEALLLANTSRDALLREYGVLVSVGFADAQWTGNPSESGDKTKDKFVGGLQERMYGHSMLDKGGDNRTWASEGFWIEEDFTMAAIEAEMNGHDPGPLIEVAELARQVTVKGIKAKVKANGYFAEKASALNPARFVDGGEYARTHDQVQKGFGMTIGVFRALVDRKLYDEVSDPRENSWRQFTLSHSLGGLLVAQQAFDREKVYT